jgi:hypothetical protein
MTDDPFLRIVQSRAARIAIGASTVRGRGNTGTVAACRSFLRHLDLAPFGSADGAAFALALNRSTEALQATLPRSAQHWGIARKALNIFLRDALYTTYLDTAYQLRKAESLFEIPLDSITAIQLKRAAGRATLPPWPGVKHLTPSLSAQFQKAAAVEAGKRGLARVHLDAIWWSVGRDNDADLTIAR